MNAVCFIPGTVVPGMTHEVFIQAYKSHHKVIYTNALRLTRCSMLAEELTQEAFVRLWVKREDLPNIRSIESYLFVVIRNLVFNYNRQLAVARAAEQELQLGYDPVVLPESETEETFSFYEKEADRMLVQLSARCEDFGFNLHSLSGIPYPHSLTL